MEARIYGWRWMVRDVMPKPLNPIAAQLQSLSQPFFWGFFILFLAFHEEDITNQRSNPTIIFWVMKKRWKVFYQETNWSLHWSSQLDCDIHILRVAKKLNCFFLYRMFKGGSCRHIHSKVEKTRSLKNMSLIHFNFWSGWGSISNSVTICNND